MIKLAILLMSLFITSMSFAQDNNVAANLGGAIGYSINTLRYKGNETILEDLFSSGLGLNVGMNEKLNDKAKVIKESTWGFEFTVDEAGDKDIKIHRVVPNVWIDWRKITVIAGVPWCRILPGENGGQDIIPEETRCVGGRFALRFEAKDFPWEFGGSWVFRYDGADDTNLSDIHLVLVPSF